MTQPGLSCSDQEIQEQGGRRWRFCPHPVLGPRAVCGPDWLSHGGSFWLIPAQSSSHFTAAVASQGLAAPCRVTSSHPAGAVSLSPGCCWLFLQEQQPGPPVPGCFGSLGRSLCCPLLLQQSQALIQDTGGILGQQLPASRFCLCELPGKRLWR